MANKDLIIVEGLLETCQAWQEVLDSVEDPEEKAAVGVQAVRSVDSIDGFYGSRNVIVKSELALILKEPEDEPTDAIGIRYSDIIAKGMLGRTTYLEMMGYGAIAWSLYGAKVLAEPKVVVPDGALPLGDNQPPQTDRSPRPIYMPVGFIDVAICAA